VFRWPGARLPQLDIPHFTLAHGEHVMLRGASGSGKSTLLSLIAGIHQPQQGQVNIDSQTIGNLSQAKRDQLRADKIGYIFQQFNLLPYLSAVDNVLLATRFSAVRRQHVAQANASAPHQALALLEQLGLSPQLAQQKSYQLSVGQQQRVAAARALFGKPQLIIADEPTSALDTERRDAFLKVLFDACQQQRTALLFVTHDGSLARYFERTIEMTQLNQVPA